MARPALDRLTSAGAGADLCPQPFKEARHRFQARLLLVKDCMEERPFHFGSQAGAQVTVRRQGGKHDIDQAVCAVKPAPEIIVISITSAKKGPETIESNAF